MILGKIISSYTSYYLRVHLIGDRRPFGSAGRPIRRPSLAALALLAGMSAVPICAAEGATPSLDSPELAQGPFAAAHMLLEKTIFGIRVADIDVRFDRPAQSRFAELSHDQPYSEALEGRLAAVAIGAGHAVVQMTFLRDIPFQRWLGGVRDNLGQARAAGLITAQIERRVGDGIPDLFATIRERGYQKGDRLIYAVTPETLRTVVVSAGGRVLVDTSDGNPGVRRVVLASFFAPQSDSRQPLLRALVGDR
jgi:hypothetical protein